MQKSIKRNFMQFLDYSFREGVLNDSFMC
jgi:hypothetical protein